MPSPKSGKSGNAVSPIDPKNPTEADKAELPKAATGKDAEKPHKPPKTDEEKKEKKSWIEIELVDEEKNPVAGEPFKLTLPDGSVFSGTLDDKGFYRLEGIDPGSCQITFTRLDKDAWEKA